LIQLLFNFFVALKHLLLLFFPFVSLSFVLFATFSDPIGSSGKSGDDVLLEIFSCFLFSSLEMQYWEAENCLFPSTLPSTAQVPPLFPAGEEFALQNPNYQNNNYYPQPILPPFLANPNPEAIPIPPARKRSATIPFIMEDHPANNQRNLFPAVEEEEEVLVVGSLQEAEWTPSSSLDNSITTGSDSGVDESDNSEVDDDEVGSPLTSPFWANHRDKWDELFPIINKYLQSQIATKDLLHEISTQFGTEFLDSFTTWFGTKEKIPKEFFQANKKKPGKRRPQKWTAAENERLLALVTTIPGGAGNNRWTEIAKAMGDKSSSQCFQHWNRVLNPEIIKKHWHEEEEKLLLQSVAGYQGKKVSWAAVASRVRGRTDTQCRYHYTTCVKSAAAPWLDYEDAELVRLVYDRNTRLNGVQWVEVATTHYKTLLSDKKTQYKTPPRSALDCKTRWEILNER